VKSLSVDEITTALASARGALLAELLERYANDPRSGVRNACVVARRRDESVRAERRRISALYQLERTLHAQGHAVVAGIDEVGRGALAGPLTAAAVVLPPSPRIAGLDDSKRLVPAHREEVAERVRETAVAWSIAHVSPAEIDSLGMTAALRRAFTLAIEGLSLRVDHVILDGLPMGVTASETAVVQGDSKVAAVAAASVIAKVARDALMVTLAPTHAEYAFEVNKGYGTSEHLQVLARVGPCVQHRRSFAPCAQTLTLFDPDLPESAVSSG